MTKVYVVSTGQYSDYSITGIFDEEHKEDAYQITEQLEEGNEVRVYELNKLLNSATKWKVILFRKQNKDEWAAYLYSFEEDSTRVPDPIKEKPKVVGYKPPSSVRTPFMSYSVYVWNKKDKEHALKAGMELILQHIAKEAWE